MGRLEVEIGFSAKSNGLQLLEAIDGQTEMIGFLPALTQTIRVTLLYVISMDDHLIFPFR